MKLLHIYVMQYLLIVETSAGNFLENGMVLEIVALYVIGGLG